MTQFSIFHKLTKNRSSSNLYLKDFENESLDKAGFSPFKTKINRKGNSLLADQKL